MQSNFIFSRRGWRLNYDDAFVVHTNHDRHSMFIKVNLCVDVISSRNGHSQFAVFVSHAAKEMAVWVVEIPVFDH